MAVKTTEKRQFQKLTLKRALKVQVIILDRFDLERGHYCSQKNNKFTAHGGFPHCYWTYFKLLEVVSFFCCSVYIVCQKQI